MSGFFEQAKSKVCLSEGTHATMRPLVSTWEQRKLGEVASEFQSGEFISATEITENGDYPVYGGNGLRGYANRYNHEGFYALIGRQGALCGNVNCADGKAYFTEHAVAVQANQCNDTGFLVYLLSRMNLGQYSGQSAQPGLAVSTLKEVETLLPNKHEQYRIGSLLKDLDSLITLHQREPPHTMKEGKNANRYQWRIAFLRLLLAMD